MATEKIVVVGASAGGVEALGALVRALPADFPAPVVIVLHIPGQHPSLLPRILARKAALPVLSAEEGERVQPGRVYVAPPDRHVLVDHEGVLHTPRGPKENSHRPAIDPLFRSAALAYGPNAVGVILTGTRDDGTSGLSAIKQCGGIAVVQDPDDAAYASMPRSALDHVEVDHCVPLRDIAARLIQVVSEHRKTGASTGNVRMIEKETRIAAMTPKSMQEDDRPGQPSAFSCPDCGGVLWEIEEGDMVRYRCRVGHAYSPESMVGALDDALEEALWIALKTLEESARLAHRLAESEGARGQAWLVRRFREREKDARQRAEVIRQFLSDEPEAVEEKAE